MFLKTVLSKTICRSAVEDAEEDVDPGIVENVRSEIDVSFPLFVHSFPKVTEEG